MRMETGERLIQRPAQCQNHQKILGVGSSRHERGDFAGILVSLSGRQTPVFRKHCIGPKIHKGSIQGLIISRTGGHTKNQELS